MPFCSSISSFDVFYFPADPEHLILLINATVCCLQILSKGCRDARQLWPQFDYISSVIVTLTVWQSLCCFVYLFINTSEASSLRQPRLGSNSTVPFPFIFIHLIQPLVESAAAIIRHWCSDLFRFRSAGIIEEGLRAITLTPYDKVTGWSSSPLEPRQLSNCYSFETNHIRN